MGRANALWASTHPAYDLFCGGYTCLCKHHSQTMPEHVSHVKEKHIQDKEFCEQILSWKQFDDIFGHICKFCSHKEPTLKQFRKHLINNHLNTKEEKEYSSMFLTRKQKLDTGLYIMGLFGRLQSTFR